MMFSNTIKSIDPLSNPLNAHVREVFNGYLNKKNTDLPSAIPYNQLKQDQLHVPQAQERPLSLASIQSIVNDYEHQKTWNNQEIYSLPAVLNSKIKTIDKKSYEYWKHAEEEAKKLEANMTDEQKKLLADLDQGKIFPQSKLEDDI